MKRITASSPTVRSLLCVSSVFSFGHNFRASPSCSHGLRRSDETEELVGDLNLSSSNNNHGFLCLCCILCVVWAVLEPVVPLMLDRNTSFHVNNVATGEPLSLRRDDSAYLVKALLQRSSRGVCQALPLMPARSHFGEFLTELSLAILLLHLVCVR
ncbi:BnaC09g13740D [Brassica napus]|uniref:(rape) hypothetical protein n=1 Tax=Brassica napus TaxID=3708 RepID=A0A078G270_BRANA|nr:unnamed protein product [Brassica napus]CDY19529.1 BnaC09g13740D [Brassica napus]